jgi:hypothetical protein
MEMNADSSVNEASAHEDAVPGKTDRPPPIILTSLKSVVKENFEFRNTRNGTRAIMSGMANFQAVKSHLQYNNLAYYTFYPKSEKPIKAVIRHLPHNPAEDISDALVSFGFDVISVKQITDTCRSPPEVSKTINLPFS